LPRIPDLQEKIEAWKKKLGKKKAMQMEHEDEL
jgi:hypothetical protein